MSEYKIDGQPDGTGEKGTLSRNGETIYSWYSSQAGTLGIATHVMVAMEESLRNELAELYEETIADYQEQAEQPIKSGVAADNALELVNDELVKVQAKLDAWQNGGLREYQAKRQEIAQLKAHLKSANAELASMNVDNTKLWKENELLQKQLSEPIIDDINKLDGNHIATIPLSSTAWHIEKDGSDCENEDVSFDDFLKQSLADDVTNMQHELDMQALHEYHKARKESDLYFIDYEDGVWYIIKKGETIAEDYSHSVQDAITKCKNLIEYQDIVEKPIPYVMRSGVITAIRKVTTKKGQQMAFLTLGTGIEIVVFPRTLYVYRQLLENMQKAEQEVSFGCQFMTNPDNELEYLLESIIGFEPNSQVDEFAGIVERPVIHSDSYRQADEDNMNYNADIGDSLK